MEQMLPSAMVPGLVTVKGKDGKTQNLWPIDAKEAILSGEYELVDNGSVEAARLNANPLKGMPVGNPEVVVAEVTGIAGAVVMGQDEATTAKIIASGDNADRVPATAQEEAPAPEKPAAKPAPSPTKPTDTKQ